MSGRTVRRRARAAGRRFPWDALARTGHHRGVPRKCFRTRDHVDHRHRTGRVRGVLLQLQFGHRQVGDDPDSLRRAIAYLEGNAWKPTLVAPGVYQLPS
ncbi:endonuclease VII domain-containing protein [Streptomyces sp. NBC_01166]|uniref:endonuclease domain-containing protein n=1 Tax=Streptomyces sp. NBC_01166 TaxID=2903755 RepID=UPI00386DBB2A|nr:endonuclease VII domain-containing protein [Streptomyces sp. NBC_01166]